MSPDSKEFQTSPRGPALQVMHVVRMTELADIGERKLKQATHLLAQRKHPSTPEKPRLVQVND